MNVMSCNIKSDNLFIFYLHSAYDYSIGSMDKAIVKTDIQIAVPHGCYGRVGECFCHANATLQLLHFFFVPPLSPGCLL